VGGRVAADMIFCSVEEWQRENEKLQKGQTFDTSAKETTGGT